MTDYMPIQPNLPEMVQPHHYLRSDHKAVSLPTLILSTQDFKFGATGRRLVLISARSCGTMEVRFDNGQMPHDMPL